MLRIAHISDLHIRASSANNDSSGFMEAATKALLEGIGIPVHAGGHDEVKLKALLVSLAKLNPDVVAITGDITNFGDRDSFQLASEFVGGLRGLSKTPQILCVPGNHDALAERAVKAREQSGFPQRQGFKFARIFSKEIRTAEKAGDRDYFRNKWEPEANVQLLKNYTNFCRQNELAACDPSAPIDIKLPWGIVQFFLFDSVNGPGLEANKGLIGPDQLQRAASALSRSPQASNDDVVRIALLHHHPVSAPLSDDKSVNRFYDWMDDGPLFLEFLNRHGFNFVLHGHQHEPFVCSVEYGLGKQKKTTIVAAGSASQADKGNKPSNSFNVIDLISPFQSRVSRQDYAIGEFKEPEHSRIVELVAINELRLDNSQAEDTVEDWALRSLITNSFRDLETIGADFHYEELLFDVEITAGHMYKGRYRRRGTVRKEGGAKGPIFVITGSPAMAIPDMALEALNYPAPGAPERLGPVLTEDKSPNLKIVQVQMRDHLAVGDSFDVELCFQWQASEKEPNSFDAFSLIGFRHPVRKVRYQVHLPRRASQLSLHSVGAGIRHVAAVKPRHEDLGEAKGWRYSFELTDPAHVAYVIRFPHDEV